MLSTRTISASVGRLLLAALVTAAALVPAGSASAAALSTQDPAASLPIRSCPAGDSLVLPSSSSVESDGWIRLNYVVNGLAGYREFPPVGFDPAQASDAMLASHHMPVRSQPTGDTSQWGSAIGRLSWDRAKGLCHDPNSSNSGSSRVSDHWGGDEVRQQPTYDFAGVQATIVQPSPKTSGTLCQDAKLSSWVGLGGGDPVPNTPLIQAGTSVTNGKSASDTSYWAWWQYVAPVGAGFNFATQVRKGDTMYEYVQVSGGGAWTEVWNFTTGSVDSYWLSGVTTADSAEWIDERPNVYGTMPNYGQTSWSNMQVLRTYSSTWTGAYSEPTEWWIYMMVGSRYLSKPSGTDSGNHMHDTWYACQ